MKSRARLGAAVDWAHAQGGPGLNGGGNGLRRRWRLWQWIATDSAAAVAGHGTVITD